MERQHQQPLERQPWYGHVIPKAGAGLEEIGWAVQQRETANNEKISTEAYQALGWVGPHFSSYPLISDHTGLHNWEGVVREMSCASYFCA
jgi:hypothetical protein